MDTDCGHCGDPAVQTIALQLRGQEYELDVCERHRRELLQGLRPRGRLLSVVREPVPARLQARRRRDSA